MNYEEDGITWKEEKEIKSQSLLKELSKFLCYLEEQDLNPRKREKKYFENRRYKDKGLERALKIAKEEEYFSEEREHTYRSGKGEENGKKIAAFGISGTYDTYRITIKGLKFLQDYKKEERNNETTKLTLFLTTLLVVTTIASFFNNLKTINPIALTLIYGIFTFLIYIYFKKQKNIKF